MDDNMKKMIIIGIIVCMVSILLGAAGWFFYHASQYKVYKSLKDGFEIKYPKDWKLNDHPDVGVIAVFISPKENAMDNLLENVNISWTDLSVDPKTLEQYVAEVKDEMTTMFNDIVLISDVAVTLSGHEGHQFVFHTKGGPVTMTIIVYAFLYRDVAYNITYMGDDDRYQDRDKPVLQEMIDSLKILF